jgi:hypothetical protein
MRNILAGVAVAAVLAVPAMVDACGYGMPSPAARLALSDAVLVGKVLSVESRTVRLRLGAGQEPLAHDVVVVKVESMLRGDDRLTHIRLAVMKHQVMQPGFEGVFFLNANSEEMVYTMSSDFYDYPINKANNPGFKQQVEQLRRMGQLLREPRESLQSKKAEDRFLTAALLISQYRTFQSGVHEGTGKTAPIDAATSKLILRALADSDWNNAAADFRLTPWRMFNMLGVKATDGLAYPDGMTSQQQRVEATKKWIKEHEDRFVIQTYVRR